MTKKFELKALTFTTIQFLDTSDNIEEIQNFLNEVEPLRINYAELKPFVVIYTPQGEKRAYVSDYILKDSEGCLSVATEDDMCTKYRCVDTFIDRLVAEHSDLKSKFEKCATFVDSKTFREVIKEDYPAFLLSLQREMMGRYLQILEDRTDIARGVGPQSELARMSFGMAVEALKFGLVVRREGWNGKNIYVFKQVPATINMDIVPKMQSLPKSAKILIGETAEHIDYTSQCLIYNTMTGRADSWVPSISDVFAEDWEIVKL